MTIAQQRIHAAALKIFAEKGVGEISVSELANVAGVARGTIYNNLSSIVSLFEDLTEQLTSEMNERVSKSINGTTDPVQRLSNGIRLYIRRAHEEPYWGRFFVRYALTSNSMRALWDSPPMQDLVQGIEPSRYSLPKARIQSAMGLIVGSVLAAMLLVLEGHKTWRDAGTEIAEMILMALGLPADEAHDIAMRDLPQLAALD